MNTKIVFLILLKRILSSLKIISISVVLAFAILFLANPLAVIYIRNNPEIMMSEADRINQNTRAVREKLIPKDKITEWYDLDTPDDLYVMLDERFKAGAEFESYTHFRSRVVQGVYHGATDAGYRLVKDNGPWPIENTNFNIFFFGGSTSFGVGPYWATVANYLQQTLNETNSDHKPVRVYNFGRSGYQSTQEVILLGRLIASGNIPNMAIFLDGLNDFCFRDGKPSSWQTLARYFNSINRQYQERMTGYGVSTDWRSAQTFFTSLPSVQLMNAFVSQILETPIPVYLNSDDGNQTIVNEPGPPIKELEKVIARWIANSRQATALGNEFKFETMFVWQPIPTYKYDRRNHIFYPDRLGCHTGSRDGYPVMAKETIFSKKRKRYLWLADLQETATENLYIDSFHYTAPMSRKIAKEIASEIRSQKLISHE